MATVIQTSTNPNLFAQTGERIVSNNNVTAQSVGLTDQEEADELQEQFLQILLTQLQNQNPLDPVDTSEYTSQLVQYSSLEQQLNTNVRLGGILDALQISSSFSAFSYIGNDVEIATNQTVMQNDIADWNYALEGDADAVEVTIRNSTGTIVYTENVGLQTSGSYEFSFDRADSTVPIGEGEVLTIDINARTNEGVEIETDVATNVRVDAVETGTNGEIILRAGGLLFGVNDVLKILRA